MSRYCANCRKTWVSREGDTCAKCKPPKKCSKCSKHFARRRRDSQTLCLECRNFNNCILCDRKIRSATSKRSKICIPCTRENESSSNLATEAPEPISSEHNPVEGGQPALTSNDGFASDIRAPGVYPGWESSSWLSGPSENLSQYNAGPGGLEPYPYGAAGHSQQPLGDSEVGYNFSSSYDNPATTLFPAHNTYEDYSTEQWNQSQVSMDANTRANPPSEEYSSTLPQGNIPPPPLSQQTGAVYGGSWPYGPSEHGDSIHGPNYGEEIHDWTDSQDAFSSAQGSGSGFGSEHQGRH